MSLKPKKFSELKREQAELKQKMQKKHKEIIYEMPRYTYIVSEGTKTEPHYIEAIAREINKKYGEFSTGRFIFVQGTGRNTKGLLEYARTNVDKDFPRAERVWLMYDRDDFPPDNFDNTQYSAEGKTDDREYRVAWSNECIELWFLLHFQELSVNVGRKKYRELLRGYCGYKKNMKNIYEILQDKTETAIDRARRQYEAYGDAAPSQRCPATRVYQLIEELQGYLI